MIDRLNALQNQLVDLYFKMKEERDRGEYDPKVMHENMMRLCELQGQVLEVSGRHYDTQLRSLRGW